MHRLIAFPHISADASIPSCARSYLDGDRAARQKHRLENILGKAPKEVRQELKAAILESFHADDYEKGLEKGQEVVARYRQRFPSAMKCMVETLEACLQVLRLPAAHHKRLRTANLLERTFGEVKCENDVIVFTTDGSVPTSESQRFEEPLDKGEIHYTLDGQPPSLLSPVYESPLPFRDTVTIKARFFDGDGRAKGEPLERVVSRVEQ